MNKKFSLDVAVNSISTFVVSICAIAINTLIGKFYGVYALGIYNTSLAIYVVLSIAAVLGIHNSILKYTAEKTSDMHEQSVLLGSGFLIILGSSFCVTGITYLILVKNFFPLSLELKHSLLAIILAIPFFSLNKGVRCYFNGLRYMRLYAGMDILRWGGILLGTLLIIFFNKSYFQIFKVFVVIELIILVLSGMYIRIKLKMTQVKTQIKWIKIHLNFGIKTFLSDSLLIVNNKIDILMLAAYSNPTIVGIYSLAAEVAKGFLFLPAIIRVNFAPIISLLTAEKDIPQLIICMKRIRKIVVFLTIPFAVIFIFGYPWYIYNIMQDASFSESIPVFNILMVGVVIASFFFWFGNILSMSGYPQDAFIRNTILTISNILLNLILIPIFGMIGAALATMLTYGIRIVTLHYFVQKRLHLDIFSY